MSIRINLPTVSTTPIHGLPKTGVTSSLVDYDDGYYKRGYPVTGNRFTDNGDGTITDNATGLMWVKETALIIPGASVIPSNQIQVARGAYSALETYALGDLVSQAGSLYVCVVAITAPEAFTAGKWRHTVWTASAANLTTPGFRGLNDSPAYTRALDYAGFTDWRMPNIVELLSLVQYDASSMIDLTYFPNGNKAHVSSTNGDGVGAMLWQVDFSVVGLLGDSPVLVIQSDTAVLRPVRG